MASLYKVSVELGNEKETMRVAGKTISEADDNIRYVLEEKLGKGKDEYVIRSITYEGDFYCGRYGLYD